MRRKTAALRDERLNIKNAAVKAALVGIAGNAALAAFKLIVGLAAESGGMISDAVHSMSDIFAGIIVLIGIVSSARQTKIGGRIKPESLASAILALVLFLTGAMIAKSAVIRLFKHEYLETEKSALALIMAVIPVAVKEALYRYTRSRAKRLSSTLLEADAKHHRSDELASIGALAGMAGTYLNAIWVDSAACIVISLFIFKAARDIFKDAFPKL